MKKTNNERIEFLKAKIKMCDLIILNNKKEILKRRKKTDSKRNFRWWKFRNSKVRFI